MESELTARMAIMAAENNPHGMVLVSRQLHRIYWTNNAGFDFVEEPRPERVRLPKSLLVRHGAAATGAQTPKPRLLGTATAGHVNAPPNVDRLRLPIAVRAALMQERPLRVNGTVYRIESVPVDPNTDMLTFFGPLTDSGYCVHAMEDCVADALQQVVSATTVGTAQHVSRSVQRLAAVTQAALDMGILSQMSPVSVIAGMRAVCIRTMLISTMGTAVVGSNVVVTSSVPECVFLSPWLIVASIRGMLRSSALVTISVTRGGTELLIRATGGRHGSANGPDQSLFRTCVAHCMSLLHGVEVDANDSVANSNWAGDGGPSAAVAGDGAHGGVVGDSATKGWASSLDATFCLPFMAAVLRPRDVFVPDLQRLSVHVCVRMPRLRQYLQQVCNVHGASAITVNKSLRQRRWSKEGPLGQTAAGLRVDRGGGSSASHVASHVASPCATIVLDDLEAGGAGISVTVLTGPQQVHVGRQHLLFPISLGDLLSSILSVASTLEPHQAHDTVYSDSRSHSTSHGSVHSNE
jgi:hypothetical protein